MPNPTKFEEVPDLTQLLVLPCGIEGRDAPEEGRVLYDSPDSGDSYDRAAWAGNYALSAAGRRLTTMMFVSNETFTIPPWRRVRGSEANAMSLVAGEIMESPPEFPDMQFVVQSRSRSTPGGILEAEPYINRKEPLGLVVHYDHAPKALWMAALILPDVKIVPCYADNPDRTQEAVSLVEHDSTDRMYKLAFMGLRPGNLPAIRRREALVAAVVTGLVSARAGAMALAAAIHPELSRQA